MNCYVYDFYSLKYGKFSAILGKDGEVQSSDLIT